MFHERHEFLPKFKEYNGKICLFKGDDVDDTYKIYDSQAKEIAPVLQLDVRILEGQAYIRFPTYQLYYYTNILREAGYDIVTL